MSELRDFLADFNRKAGITASENVQQSMTIYENTRYVSSSELDSQDEIFSEKIVKGTLFINWKKYTATFSNKGSDNIEIAEIPFDFICTEIAQRFGTMGILIEFHTENGSEWIFFKEQAPAEKAD